MKSRRWRNAKLLARALVVGVLLLSHSSVVLLVSATGKGPIALWESESNNRTVIVADSSLPGLLVVDLQWGQTLERLDMSYWEANPISVASCDDCPFLFLTNTSGRYFIVHLIDTVAKLLASSSSGKDGIRRGLRLDEAVVEEIGHEDEVVRDGRTCTLAPRGSSIYLSSYRDHSVYKISAAASIHRHDKKKGEEPGNVLEDPDYALEAQPLLDEVAPHHPYGIDFDSSRRNLLVTMHKQDVWRIDAMTGEVRRKYNAVRAGCPGALEHDPNQRQSVDDHTIPDMDSILILATSPVSYDAVIWRLVAIPKNQTASSSSSKQRHHNDRRYLRTRDRRRTSRTRHSKESTATHVGHGKKTCQVAFGGIGRGSDWVDGVHESILFTRPHHMVLSRHLPDTLLVTDVDNRALRVIHLRDGSSHSIMYDRDRVLNEAKAFHQERVDQINTQLHRHKEREHGGQGEAHSLTPVQKLQQEKAHKETLLRTAQRKPHIFASQKSCADFHQHDGNAFVDYEMTISPFNTPVKVLTPQQLRQDLMTAAQAEEYCASIGARLCEPSELKRRYDGDHDGGWGRRSRDSTITWTAASCASCWLRRPELLAQCPASHRTTNGTLLNKKTQNQTHTALEFQQSWNSGRALEVGLAATLQLSPDHPVLSKAASLQSFYGSKTICPGRQAQSYRATVTCCVDCFAPLEARTSSSEEDRPVAGGE